jgi:hypothetical protein
LAARRPWRGGENDRRVGGRRRPWTGGENHRRSTAGGAVVEAVVSLVGVTKWWWRWRNALIDSGGGGGVVVMTTLACCVAKRCDLPFFSYRCIHHV